MIPKPLAPLKIFVYGTLKPGEVNYRLYCEGKVADAQEAIAFGQLFSLPAGYPAMTDGEDLVYGTLLSFSEESILQDLDQLEGFDPQRPELENEYQRKVTEVYDLNHQLLGTCWTYVMTTSQTRALNGIRITEGKWTGN